MLTKILAAGCSALFLFSACNTSEKNNLIIDPVWPDNRQVLAALTAPDRQVIQSGNGFGFNLFAALSVDDPDSNIFVSPLSVATALAMAYNGAAGSTETAMAAGLGYAGLPRDSINALFRKLIPALTGADAKVRMDVANSIWSAMGLLPEQSFLDLNLSAFNAANQTVNFADPATVGQINAWVSDHTENKITKIVASPMDAATEMLLINAIYFKGNWSTAFDPRRTADELFQLANGTQKNCRMMNADAAYLSLHEPGVNGLELPYGDSLFVMDLLQPADSAGLPGLITALRGGAWDAWQDKFNPWKGRIALPKFKLEYGKSLVDDLKTLGMSVAFSDAADFSGIRKSGGLTLMDVIHKTYVNVDEIGTEAAAVTAVVVGDTAVESNYLRFDRPFICLIREKTTGAVIFIGRIMNPSA